jgi:hypothetical protein
MPAACAFRIRHSRTTSVVLLFHIKPGYKSHRQNIGIFSIGEQSWHIIAKSGRPRSVTLTMQDIEQRRDPYQL